MTKNKPVSRLCGILFNFDVSNSREGDKIFLKLLNDGIPFFSLKLVYDGHGGLLSAALNGKPLPI